MGIEFYIIAAFVAAAVVGMAAMPSHRGEIRTFLYGGELLSSDTTDATEPSIEAVVDSRGRLVIVRHGLTGVNMSGAYSVAVKVSGFDVTIDERLTPGRQPADEALSASAIIDCLGPERYHIQYISEATGRSAAFSLNIRPGNRMERLLA